MKSFRADMSRRSKPSLSDVAQESGVSMATVSRALSQPGLLRADTLQRVRAAALKLGYMPDRAARALASGRTATIGVAIPTLNSTIFAATLQEMQRCLSEAGFQLLVSSHEYDPAAELVAVERLLSHGIDGLALVGGARPDACWALIERSGAPLVQMWCGRESHDCVGVDNRKAGMLAVRHLIELGHRRIGVVTGHQRHNDRQRERLRGVREAMAEAGLALAAAYVTEQPLTLLGGRGGCSILMALADPPTGIVGTVDVLAIGTMVEGQHRGLRVPEDVSIVGIDNVELAAHVFPPLTTIHIPTSLIGIETAKRLLELIKRAGAPRELQLPIELVVRRSSSPPKTPL